jgi:hypothetical protein
MDFTFLTFLGLGVGGFVNGYIMTRYAELPKIGSAANFFQIGSMFNCALVGVGAFAVSLSVFKILNGDSIFGRKALFDYFAQNTASHLNYPTNAERIPENVNGASFFNLFITRNIFNSPSTLSP